MLSPPSAADAAAAIDRLSGPRPRGVVPAVLPAPVGNHSVCPVSSDNSKTKKKRRRKPTYYIRKEEKELLEQEVQKLKTQVELLQQRDRKGQESGFLNSMLREVSRSQQLSFAVAQSAVTGFLHGDLPNPLSSFIRLGKDWTQRHKTLVGMKDKKIRNAFEFTQARSQFLDPLTPHHSEERFENTSGDYCCTKFDLIQFEGTKSVKQVYDAIVFYHQNIEISVSERLGHITVREDFDSVDKSVSNYRLLSTQCGVDVETNVASFTEFFESFEPLRGAPCGILTADFVDDDQLNPYTPQEKARRDVSVAIVLTPHMRKKRNGEEELVVVMAQGKFHRLAHAELALSSQTVQDLRTDMCWGAVMLKAVRELLRSDFVFSAT